MRHSKTMIMVGLLAIGGCGGKDEDKPGDPAKVEAKNPATKDPATPVADPAAEKKAAEVLSKIAADIGVKAGGIQRDAKEGPAAVVTAATGTVEIRRVGEAQFAAAKAEDKLYSGDAVRTADKSSATITLADESIVEVAEVSSVGIGSRAGTADPASAAAVLSGLARFTVTPRAPGEGAFRVYTPAGVVLTRGTAYGVGVGASGDARVGVESGKVDVIGLAAVDATPVSVDAGHSVTLAAAGTVGAPSPWPKDDWGTWRDDVDAKLEVQVAVDAHADAMAKLNTQLVESYADLDASAKTVATFEASAAASADKGDTKTYEASLPDGAANIDASFALGGRVEALTWAYAGHATLASDIYIRHPAEVRWEVAGPRVDAAILWPKRYEVTAVGYFEPLRTQYYVHHPRGRVHAELVGIAVPTFYAKVEPPEVDPIRVRSHLHATIWIEPEMTYHASTRVVWVGPPAVEWRTSVHVSPAPFRAGVAWYVRPPTLRAHVLYGGEVTGRYTTRMVVAAPEPRASLRATWRVPVGVHVRIGAPDYRAAATARARVRLDAGGLIVRDHRAGVAVRGAVVVPNVKGGVSVNVRDRVGGNVKAGVKVGGGVGVRVGGDARAKVGAAVKVKVPVVKPPQVKVKVKAPSVKVKAGIKLGN